jgi:hypothetical protein
MSFLAYTLKIELNHSVPKIWRRVVVSPDTSLEKLHWIIQITMGWTNSHLHQFIHGKKKYAPKDLYIENTQDSDDIRLSSILKNEKDKFYYEYDFGDSWKHTITLEKIIEGEKGLLIPRCTGGRNNCPPEDCGGIAGYATLLNILTNPDHEDFEETLEWLEEDFDPYYFDIEEINDLFASWN